MAYAFFYNFKKRNISVKNKHHYTLQCALILLIEKIYVKYFLIKFFFFIFYAKKKKIKI